MGPSQWKAKKESALKIEATDKIESGNSRRIPEVAEKGRLTLAGGGGGKGRAGGGVSSQVGLGQVGWRKAGAVKRKPVDQAAC